MDDDSIWGAPGELPPRQLHAPHHPPMVRRVAAAAERPQRLEARRRGLLQRSISASHHHSHHDAQHHHHHYHHHHHHHHYYHMPRAAWEYPPVVRGMPVLGDERSDWEPSSNYPASTTVTAAAVGRRRGTGNVRRRRTFLFPWRRLRRGGTVDADDSDDSFNFSYEELIELDQRNVCRGLSEEDLAKLTAFEADKEHVKSDCHICLDAVECGAKVVSLKCGHLYHQGCIHTWLKMKRTCPICRCEV